MPVFNVNRSSPNLSNFHYHIFFFPPTALFAIYSSSSSSIPKEAFPLPSSPSKTMLSTPLLDTTRTRSDDAETSPTNSTSIDNKCRVLDIPKGGSHRSLAVLSGHVSSVSCLALCGEFILSASQGKDIIVWQQPDLRQYAKFGQGDGSVKALVTVGNKVFTAHQDSRIRVWKVSRRSENVFRLVGTLPTTRDYLGKFMKQSNYVETRRNHRRLWIEHADSISCLAVWNGLIYSGSWDRSLKVWRVSDLKCLESIRAHDDAINGLVAHKGVVYSASADGKIKVWGKDGSDNGTHYLKGVLVEHKDVSFNSLVVCDNGRLVYGGGSDGCVMGWQGDEGKRSWKLVCEVKAHQMAVLCVCLMGEFLCTGSADKSIGVWKRNVGGGLLKVGVLSGHQGPVKCLQASPNCVGDGWLLYSGGLDRSLRVWWVPNSLNKQEQLHHLPFFEKI